MGVEALFQELGTNQHGVVLTSQLIKAGLSRGAVRHAVQSGRLVELFGGALRLPGSSPDEQRAFAALLVAGDGAALSHDSAASLFEFPGFALRPFHVSMPRRHKLALPVDFVVHRPRRSFSTNSIGKLRVTALPRTILDCAEHLRGAALEVMLDDAHHRFDGVDKRLRSELARIKRACTIPGATELTRLLDERLGQASESREELRFWRLLRRSHLPPFRLQFAIRDDSGNYVMTVDFVWLLHKVAVHFDSFRWHARRVTFDDDAMKRSRLSRLGWHNFVVTSATLDSGQCITDLAAVLANREPQRSLAI